MNSLQDVARQAAERQSEVLVEIGGNWLHSVADAVLAAVLAEQERARGYSLNLPPALAPLAPPQTPEPQKACVCTVDDGLVREWVQKAREVAKSKGYCLPPLAPAVESQPTVTWQDAKRLTVALNLCLSALDRHDDWCGHRNGSPGDSIFRRASEAARAALWPSAVEPPSGSAETHVGELRMGRQ